MRYREITFQNFRVFRGTQTVTLPDGDGVVVVYGLNGKGKTSFLNGIRWAWTGVARRRGNRVVEPVKLVNRDAVDDANGPVVCFVQIVFDADDARWELTRSLTKDGDQLTPELTLSRNGVSLTTSDAEKRVAELMPPEIEQFFLFDGELLDQYEKLVDDDGIAGSPLRDSIERILGVPVVRNAARDMRALAEEAGKKIADAAKRERATRELGQALQTAQDLAKAHRENAEREDALITQLEGEFRDVEERLAEQQNKLELLAQRDAKRGELERLEARLGESRDCFAAALAEAWKAVLVDPVTERVTALETELERDRALLNDAIVAVRITEALQAAGGDTCPVCANDLDEEHATHLRTFVGDVNPDAVRELADQVATSTERLKTLRRVVDDGARVQLRELENDFRRAEVDVHDAEEDLKQLQEQLSETSENALTDLVTQSRNLALKLERAKETYRDEDTRYQEQRATIDRLQTELARAGGTIDPAVRRREELTKSLATLFDEAVAEYRERLKQQVQDTATKLFKNMRTETEFLKLVINDQYGLRILDTQGRPVEDRSAGYEHLVALSLIGALQDCSPVSGPIVMDSPFGRLDPDHVTGVVGQLNALADQVFLLVHEGELDRDSARNHLRGRMLAEYELRRITPYHTEIKELRS